MSVVMGTGRPGLKRTVWRARGFTLIELLVVIVILGLAGALLVPQMSSMESLRVHAAVRTLVADLTFAQSDAVAFQRRRAVVFDVDASSYRIIDVVGTSIDEANTLFQPDGPEGRYVVSLTGDRYGRARITGATFGVGPLERTLIFDDTGSPAADATSDAAGTGGQVVIEGGGERYVVVVEPFTGRVVVRRGADAPAGGG